MNLSLKAIATRNMANYMKSARMSKLKNESQNQQRDAFGNNDEGDEELKQNVLDETEKDDGPENFMEMTKQYLEDPSKSTHMMTEEIAAEVSPPDEDGDMELENHGVQPGQQEARKMVKSDGISAPPANSVTKYVYTENDDTEMGTGKKKKR